MVKRINRARALNLLKHADLLELGARADQIRRELHPQKTVTYVVDRNINYTNICISGCKFCAFNRKPGHPQGYVLTRRQIYRKIEELLDQGGTQILMQGGINPALGLEWFEELFRAIKDRYPIHIHSLSPPEVDYLARKEKLTVAQTMARLKAAGLDSLPGGGAEILSDRVRRKLSPKKVGVAGWLKVMEEAHQLGMITSATMMFGSVEKDEDIVEHLFNLRDLQDRTHGFIAFIPWSFQPKNTALPNIAPASGVRYLRVLALSRIVLDNVPNLQVSWVTQGAKIAQTALYFGANDFGSTMLEENVVRSAGASFRLSKSEIVRQIKAAGFTPAQRNQSYHLI